MNEKIWIHEKTYHNFLTLTKPANVSLIVNANKILVDESMTFVDYDDKSV